MRAPLRFALGELREHLIIYGAIVTIIALSMTVFTTQNAIQEYQDYVNTKSVNVVYGDYAVTAPGITSRQLLARAPAMDDAQAVADAVARHPGYRAAQRGNADATVYVAAFKGDCDQATNYTADAGVFWGVDLPRAEVGDVRPYLVEGKWFDPTANHTQAALGAPAGAYHQGKPTVTGANPPCVDFPQHYAPPGSPGYQAPYPVVIGRASAQLHELRLGDVVLTNMLTSADRGTFGTPFFVVVGIYEVGQPKFEELNYFVPLQSLKEIQEWAPGEANYVAVDAPASASEEEVLRVLAQAAPGKDHHTTKTLKTLWIGNLGDVAQLLLLTTVSAALLLAATAVKFVMDSVLVRKTREIGTLKALGARDGQVVGIFLGQAIVLGLVAAALGYGLARGTMEVVEQVGVQIDYVLGSKIEIRFLVTPVATLLAFALPIGVAVLAAIVPAWRAARLAPVEAMRRGALGTRRVKMESRSRRVTTGRLARNELRDNAGVYVVVALAVAIALGTYGLQAAFQNNLREQVRVGVQDTISGDVMLLADTATPRHAFAGAPLVADAEETAQALEARGYRAVVRTMLEGLVFFENASVEGGQDVDGAALVGLSPEDEQVLALKDKLVDGAYFDPTRDYSQAQRAEAQRQLPVWFPSVFPQPRLVLNASYPEYPILVGRAAAESHGVGVGDRFTGVFNSPTPENQGRRVYASFTVLGIYESGLPFNDLVVYYVPLVAANELRGFSPGQGTAVIVKAPDEGADPEELAAAVAGIAPGHNVFSWHAMTVYFTGGLFDAMSLVTTAAILITIVLAGVAILYAMDASVKRKTKEIGVLKALGASDARVVGIFLRQGIVIGIASGLLAYAGLRAAVAVLLSIGLSAELPLGARQKLGFLITPEITAVVLLVPLGVAIVASLLPAWRAARLSPVEALREGELSL